LKNEKFKFKNQKKLIISNQKKSEIHSEINKLKIDIKNYRDEMNTLIYKLRDEIKNIKINLKEQKINIKKTNNNEESRKIYTHFLSNEKKLDKKIKEIQNFYENPKWLEKFKKEYILLNVESKSIVSKEEKIQKNINKKQAKLNQVQMSKETEISEKNSMEILRKNLVEIENSRKNGKISTTRIWITALEVVKKRIPIKKS
ncbi:MAG: hypothetical protein K4H23_04415, partial [Mollicutes bacterium PWAP]|nr:hypothetical protein [Mollicutes bacterium PWAP]